MVGGLKTSLQASIVNRIDKQVKFDWYIFHRQENSISYPIYLSFQLLIRITVKNSISKNLQNHRGEKMSENDSMTVDKSPSILRRWGIYALILLVIFLLGFIPMWLQKRQVSQELETIQKMLRKSEIKGLLTTAIVESKRGEYEPARKDTSDFFTRLTAEIDKGDESALTETERGKLKPIFVNRDSTITMLAQRDQASTERLTDIYVTYQQAVGQTPSTAPSVAPTTPAPSPTSSPALPTAQPTQ